MTREEEITKASVEANADIAVRPGAKILRECCRLAFQKGAKWADLNPKSPWISVEDDLPCNYEELITTEGYYKKETINVITIDKYGIIEDNYMVLYDNGELCWKYGMTPLYWMPILKLPKE